VDGETYAYQFVISAAMPQPAIESLADPDDPVQDFRFLVTVESNWYYITGRTLWDDIDVLGSPAHFYDKQDDVQSNAAFMVTDSDNLLFLQLENFCSAYSYTSPAYETLTGFDIPMGQDWYAFLDNSHRHGNAVMLGGEIRLEHWGTPVDDPQMPPVSFSLSSPSPNPCSGSTKLILELPSAAEIGVKIYNPRGQMIRSLASEALPAGTHNLIWDGKNGSGADVASGLYLIRVQSGDHSATRKVLVIK